jgi:hypothetical protein
MCEMMSVPHRKHAYGPPLPVTGSPFLFYTYIMFLPHRKHLWAFTAGYSDSFALLDVDDVRTSQETRNVERVKVRVSSHILRFVYPLLLNDQGKPP